MTALTINASNRNPVVDSSATFTVTLMEGTTGLSKPVRIWHFLPNRELHENGTHNTGVDGIYTFTHKYASAGQRVYYAEFDGDGTHLRSKGSVTVNVRSK
ncbi:MAG: hypothetical protein ABSE80_12065 [Halobacteriota archaeon]|jgi:hypothetical protein